MLRDEYPGTATAMVCYGNRVNGFLAIPDNGVGICGAIILGHERY